MICDEDDALCERACGGCEEAFAALFHRYYNAVHAFVFRICLDAAGADDITQEAFIKAARSLSSFRREASFKNWLYRIAVNAARDWTRKEIRERQAADEMGAIAGGTVRAADFEPVRAALASLATEVRQAVVLIYYEEMSHAQAARILGCAEATVSWRIFRAKRKLRNLLTPGGGSWRS